MNPTPLPQLEAQLVEAARRLEQAATPRRRWWRHGWALLSIGIVTMGAGVAAARVAHVGPFGYLDRFEGGNPKLRATAVASVQAPGDEPTWRAVATINHLGQLCITGGPRDERTNPDAKPTATNLNNPPAASTTCADSDEIAQTLVDPGWPGASFASGAPLDGSISDNGNVFRRTKSGKMVPVGPRTPTTRMLVYAARSADAPAPVVQWNGTRTPMQRSATQLLLKVDHRPQGLSAADLAKVRSYPDEIPIVLWAAELPVHAEQELPQVVYPGELPPHGIADNTIEVLTIKAMDQLLQQGRRDGWKYVRHIDRAPTPVRHASADQRRLFAAAARVRHPADAIPARLQSEELLHFRAAFGDARRLTIAGGGLAGPVWFVPGAMPEEMAITSLEDATCLAGEPILGQCKFGAHRWKRPLVEAITRTRGLPKGESLVWALTPPGTTRVDVLGPRDRVEHLDPAELIAIRRPQADRITRLVFRRAAGDETVRVQWPKPLGKQRFPGARLEMRRDSEGSYTG